MKHCKTCVCDKKGKDPDCYRKKITVKYKSITVVFTMKELLELGLVGCANCIEATGGNWSHPPNNHFMDQKGQSCARCPCREFKMKLRRGRQVITPTKRKDGSQIDR